ncbi:hypothetical protein [Phenylobacterium sp.]|uniref:hypothetical protein n=1 Tax=Phenylobacterium sp. TaxID=1871053 RepID=UPI0027366F12|nr:hypothetical protein [Phenylobacterium sp.]MDP3854317.1 hypothetical protein [Phenylobacterium sp.]
MGDKPPRERRPIPLVLWAALAVAVVLAFILVLRIANPPEAGRAPPKPDVIVPTSPKPTPLPDVKPVN